MAATTPELPRFSRSATQQPRSSKRMASGVPCHVSTSCRSRRSTAPGRSSVRRSRTLPVRCLPADPVCRLVAESRHRRQDSARLPQPTECGERDAHRPRSCSAYSIPRWYPVVTAKTRTSTSENHSAQRIVTSPLRFRVNSPAGHRHAESPAVKHPRRVPSDAPVSRRPAPAYWNIAEQAQTVSTSGSHRAAKTS